MHKILPAVFGFLLVTASQAEEEYITRELHGPSHSQLETMANQMLEEVKFLDALKDQFAIENNLRPEVMVSADDLRRMMRTMPGPLTPARMRLTEALAKPGGPKDLLGNAYVFDLVGSLPRIHPASVATLKSVVGKDFWGGFVDKSDQP